MTCYVNKHVKFGGPLHEPITVLGVRAGVGVGARGGGGGGGATTPPSFRNCFFFFGQKAYDSDNNTWD